MTTGRVSRIFSGPPRLGGEPALYRIHPNYPLNRPPAHSAKSLMPREHNAVHLRTVVPFGLVVRTLERSNLPSVLLRTEHRIFLLALFAEKLIHLSLLLPCRSQLAALPLDLPLKAVELLFIPRRRHRCPRRHQILPLQICRIK